MGSHFPSGSVGKESACNTRGPGLGRFPGEGMATCSSIFIWRIPWTEEPDGLWVHKESDMTEWLKPPLPLHLNRLVRKQVHRAHCEDYLDIGLYVIHKWIIWDGRHSAEQLGSKGSYPKMQEWSFQNSVLIMSSCCLNTSVTFFDNKIEKINLNMVYGALCGMTPTYFCRSPTLYYIPFKFILTSCNFHSPCYLQL